MDAEHLKRILIVDDESDVTELLDYKFKQAGYAIRTLNDPLRAIGLARDFRPDLIILDVMMPELTGVQLLRMVRADALLQDTPVIFLTARDQSADVIAGFADGGDDYVTKPFSLRELSARVRAQLRRADQAVAVETAPAMVDLGDVQVDLGGHRILRDGDVLPVKPKAFELLAFLIRHPGQAFTRDQLLEKVWGYDYFGDGRLVDVHVRRLRTKIEPDAADPRYVVTVRGLGYKLVP